MSSFKRFIKIRIYQKLSLPLFQQNIEDMKTIDLELNPELVFVQRIDLNPIEDSTGDLLYFKAKNADDEYKDVILAIPKEQYFNAVNEYIEDKLSYSTDRYIPGAGVGNYWVECEDEWLDVDGKQITMPVMNEDGKFIELQCYFADTIICDIECG